MGKFFKGLLYTLLGSFFTAVFLIIGGVILIAALVSGGEKEVKVKNNSVLTIDLDKVIVERVANDPLSNLLGDSPFSESKLGLNEILKNIKKAKRDDKIVGIYLQSGSPQTGYATAGEIRNALEDFKSSGKFIVAFDPDYSQKGYYIASVANKTYMPPNGMMYFKGISAQRTFYKGALDKLGLEMQIFKHGKFKSAVEPFMLEEMSEPSKEQTLVYTNSIWGQITEAVSESKGISVDSLNLLADQLVGFGGNTKIESVGLLDGLRYKDEVIAELKSLTSTADDKDINQVKLEDYSMVYVAGGKESFSKNEIAVIYAEGEIDGTSDGGINSDKLSKTIREARNDESIKAVVLRVNSPGGSGSGSDIIWREVSLCRDVKPVIVSMGDYAASGGYYISCCADTIVANPNTLTGSIGVFGMLPNTKEFFNDKLKVTFDGVTTNKHADFPNVTRPLTSFEKDVFQNYIEDFYKIFISRCADGRHTTTENIDEIGQGRVWTGENAVDKNLVDVLGGIDVAVNIAREKAGIEDYRVREMPELLSPLEEMLKDMKTETKAFFSESFFGINYKEVELINKVRNIEPIQARLPYDISIN